MPRLPVKLVQGWGGKKIITRPCPDTESSEAKLLCSSKVDLDRVFQKSRACMPKRVLGLFPFLQARKLTWSPEQPRTPISLLRNWRWLAIPFCLPLCSLGCGGAAWHGYPGLALMSLNTATILTELKSCFPLCSKSHAAHEVWSPTILESDVFPVIAREGTSDLPLCSHHSPKSPRFRRL